MRWPAVWHRWLAMRRRLGLKVHVDPQATPDPAAPEAPAAASATPAPQLSPVETHRAQIAENPLDAEAHRQLAFHLIFEGSFAESAEYWEKAIELEPDNLQSHFLAWLLLTGAGQMEIGIPFYFKHRAALDAVAKRENFEDDGTRYLSTYWSSQIGHLSHLDCYFKTLELGLRPPQRTVMVAPPEMIANAPYLEHWSGYLDVVSEPEEIARVQQRAECFGDFMPLNEVGSRDRVLWAPIAFAEVQRQWEAEQRAPLLQLNVKHRHRGRQVLRQLGVPEDAWFVTIHVREPGFHHDHVTQNFRNAEFASYLPAIEEVIRRGGYVIRMGDPTMSAAPRIPGLVDYAHSTLRCDWMDTFLCADNRFHIGTQSGLSLVPATFGVPTVLTNWITWGAAPWYGADLFITKHFWSERRQQRIPLEEILESHLRYNQFGNNFDAEGVQLQDNSPEEIRDVTVEMMDRLDRRANDDANADPDQARLRTQAARHGVIVNARIGREFLKANDYLLEPPGESHGARAA